MRCLFCLCFLSLSLFSQVIDFDELPELSLQILRLASEHGRITVQKLKHLCKANINTIKAHLKKLVASGYLVQHGKAKATWYTLAKDLHPKEQPDIGLPISQLPIIVILVRD